jgi:hypothetical protein
VTTLLGLFCSAALAADSDESLGHAVLRYRMQVYESYRLNRSTLDHHLQVGYSLIEAWRDRGSPLDEVDELMDWFHRATWAVQSGRPGTLPEYHVPPAPLDATRMPQIRTERSTLGANSSASASPTGQAAAHGSPTETAQGSAQSGPSPPASGNSLGSSRVEHRRLPRLPGAAPDDPPPLNPADMVPERPIEKSTFIAEKLPRLRMHLVAPRDVGDTKPLSAAPPTPLSSHLTTTRPTSAAPRRTDVNLAVLSAKIRSINLSLAAIEAELANNATRSVEQLESIVQDLRRLLDLADLARLYYHAVSPERRIEIEPLVDHGPIRALLAQRLFETRIRLIDQARLTPAETNDEQLKRLEAIVGELQREEGEDLP